MRIRRRKDGYYVIAEGGRRLGGPYSEHVRAHERLRQAEYFARRDALARRLREIAG